jgi:hypothetical protein
VLLLLRGWQHMLLMLVGHLVCGGLLVV